MDMTKLEELVDLSIQALRKYVGSETTLVPKRKINLTTNGRVDWDQIKDIAGESAQESNEANMPGKKAAYKLVKDLGRKFKIPDRTAERDRLCAIIFDAYEYEYDDELDNLV